MADELKLVNLKKTETEQGLSAENHNRVTDADLNQNSKKPETEHDLSTEQNNTSTNAGTNQNINETEPKFKFGEFTYDEGKTTHKFVKVTNTDKNKLDVKELVQAIKTKWNLDRPNLVISVTGGAWDFPMNRHVKEVFRKGIVEAADSTNAVVITGGTNVGVMKYTGTAMKYYKMATGKGEKVVTLGIATWSKLRDDIKRELASQIDKKKDTDIMKNVPASLTLQTPHGEKENGTLEPNHSHFILVDDDNDKWGADVPVRAELEKQIKAMHKQVLGLEEQKINYSQIRCSNTMNTKHETCNHSKSRLNGTSAWTPDSSDKDQWIEVDLGVTKLVTEVVTQGHPDGDEWVTEYKVQYKVEQEDEWEFVTDDTEKENGSEFTGNYDQNSKQINRFPAPISASFIRLVPTKWNTSISMRFELRGLDGSEDQKIQDSRFSCSSHKHEPCNHSKSRLNSTSAWTPDSSDKNQWIEVDLGVTKLVSEVVTQGNPDGDKWVTKYKIQYKVEERDEWKYVTDDTKEKNELEFTGNCDRNSEQTNRFPEPIRASFIRFVPTDWKNNISVRFELRGLGGK
ncbi:lactadherin-like [Amphiura filiformis]|uniref:lactadherin-like n=1 Tax=Amphiura filiformis TaxID=82378 RepID=UPI003B2260E6